MRKKTILAAAVVAAISAGMIGASMSQAFATDKQEAQTTQQSDEQKVADQDLIKVSEDATLTMQNVRGARLAIFNGVPAKAQVYADAAASRVVAALQDVDKYALDIKQPAQEGEEYVPMNASLGVVEGFVPDESKMKHIAKANEHLHKGETKKAVEVLKLGAIDVALSTELVPLKSAKTHIDEAVRLIGDGKYYEANLTLKALEDAVVIETFAVDAIPKTKAGS